MPIKVVFRARKINQAFIEYTEQFFNFNSLNRNT